MIVCMCLALRKARQKGFRMIQTVVPHDENKMMLELQPFVHKCAARIPNMTVEKFNTTALKIVQNLTCSIYIIRFLLGLSIMLFSI